MGKRPEDASIARGPQTGNNHTPGVKNLELAAVSIAAISLIRGVAPQIIGHEFDPMSLLALEREVRRMLNLPPNRVEAPAQPQESPSTIMPLRNGGRRSDREAPGTPEGVPLGGAQLSL